MDSFENRVTKLVEERVNKYLNDLEDDIYTVSNQVNDLFFKVANRMYDSFIEQYYMYRTTSYIRHWEGYPGTGKGSNLYYAKAFKKHKGKNPYFELIIDTNKMADDYQHDKASTVINNVMNGIRGVDPYWIMPWHGKFTSRWFSYQGTPADAFDTFIEYYPIMIEPVFMRRWKNLRKIRKY